jgi:hypothetical protein
MKPSSDINRLGQLSDRERAIVHVLVRLAATSGDQLRRLCFPHAGNERGDSQVARRVLLRMTKRGVLARFTRRVGGTVRGSEGYRYRLGPNGQRLAQTWELLPAGRARQPVEPGERFLRHRLAVSELYVRLVEAERRGELVVRSFETEPASWRTFSAPFGGTRTLKPDAFFQMSLDDELDLLWFAEVDLGSVSQTTRATQAEAYRRYWQSGPDLMPRVLWITLDVATAERAAAAIRPEAEPRGLFVVCTLDQAMQVSSSVEGAS